MLHLGEGHDFVELCGDLGPRHAEDRAVEEDVLAAGQLGVKARADLEQARRPASQPDHPAGRLGDPGEDFSSVLLPAPLRPMMPTTSPVLDVEVTSLSAQMVRSVSGSDGAEAARVNNRNG